ncbi:MAG: 50S ribosomal protein L3 [bacterium]|nr:50S ribosomal protein L3 [bacterium]
MKYIIGEKLGSTQILNNKGEITPVTLVSAEDAVVLQIKTQEKDGYTAVQVGSISKKEKNVNKSMKGHFKGLGSFRVIREFRIADTSGYNVGDKIAVSNFIVGDYVKVSGKTIGRGFQGGVRRHGFKGGPASHGHRDVLRKPGSIGGRFPQRVLKGKRMAGRMGQNRITTKNIEVVRIDAERKVIALKGALPGKNGTIIEIKI